MSFLTAHAFDHFYIVSGLIHRPSPPTCASTPAGRRANTPGHNAATGTRTEKRKKGFGHEQCFLNGYWLLFHKICGGRCKGNRAG
jgi:hypothetical protein